MKKIVVGLSVAALVIPLGFAANAMADSSPVQQMQQFETKYQKNLSVENGLMATAQTSQSTSVQVVTLSQTVTTLNQTIANMYADFQTLANTQSSLHQITNLPNTSGLSSDQKRIDNKLKQINKELEQLKHEKKGKGNRHNRLYGQLIKDRNDLTKSKKLMHVRIPTIDHSAWQAHPFAGSLPNLEKTIISLQNSAIHYTKLWISLSKSNSNTVTGSVYGNQSN